ncbi:hypothetical protein SCA6_003087, partial [Theobroma cacao]
PSLFISSHSPTLIKEVFRVEETKEKRLSANSICISRAASLQRHGAAAVSITVFRCHAPLMVEAASMI